MKKETILGVYEVPKRAATRPLSVVCKHFRLLNDNMLEKDLTRIVVPYLYAQVAHVSSLVKLDKVTVEKKKLALMILDKKLSG